MLITLKRKRKRNSVREGGSERLQPKHVVSRDSGLGGNIPEGCTSTRLCPKQLRIHEYGMVVDIRGHSVILHLPVYLHSVSTTAAFCLLHFRSPNVEATKGARIQHFKLCPFVVHTVEPCILRVQLGYHSSSRTAPFVRKPTITPQVIHETLLHMLHCSMGPLQ